MSAAPFEMLGVRLLVDAPEALLGGVRSFLGAYDPAQPQFAPPLREIALQVERGALPDLDRATRMVPVHRSKHDYWNFTAQVTGGAPPLAAWWPARQLHIELPASLSPIRVRLDRGVSDAFGGESLFHLMRSLALYLRAPGNLLHASAVVSAGSAVLFIGKVLAGKTTLMTEAVLACGARPLANDRVLVPARDPPQTVSWPSYSSFCEGTLLVHESLARAALAYEREDCPYRTRRWPSPLARDFSVSSKRTYPMTWFTGATATRFARHAPLGAVVFCQLDPALAGASWARIEASGDAAAAIAAELAKNCFDRAEPSFLPWHGVPGPGDAPRLDDLVRRACAAGTRFFRLAASPSPLSWLPAFLDEVT